MKNLFKNVSLLTLGYVGGFLSVCAAVGTVLANNGEEHVLDDEHRLIVRKGDPKGLALVLEKKKEENSTVNVEANES